MTTENNNEESSQAEMRQHSLISIQGDVDESIIVLGNHNTIHQTTNVFTPITIRPVTSTHSLILSQQEYRWKKILVEKIKQYWLEGVLEKSLHTRVSIELGWEERVKAVASPLRGIEEFPEASARTFPEGTSATDIFDNLGAGRTLLILGAPGTGKTTTLLKLARSLIERIDNDLSQPIPVILNLSSWAKKRQPIAKWLVQGLYDTFQVSKTLGKTWIDDEQLILCLDGLDEVAIQHRNACLQGLNYFLQTHGRTEVVVCSRVRDYEALSERLRVRRAIHVQPLTPQQVEHYLERAGDQLSSLKEVLTNSTDLKRWASSPLILSVMSLVYQGYSLDEARKLSCVKNFQERLFEAYIERMFQRRGNTHRYKNKQVKHWLILIAQRMTETSQTVLFIEGIQPNWLHSRTRRLQYRIESALTYFISVGMISGLFTGIVGELTAGLRFRLNSELIAGLTNGLTNGLVGGLIAGLVGGLVTGFSEDIKPVETLKWPWEEAKKPFIVGLIAGPIYGLVGGLFTGLVGGALHGSESGRLAWLIGGLFYGLVGGLFAGMFTVIAVVITAWLFDGLFGGIRGTGIKKSSRPNQDIWQSAINAWIVALTYGLIFAITYGLIYKLLGWVLGDLVYALQGGFFKALFTVILDGLLGRFLYGLTIGLFIGLFAGLANGGSACLRHFSLRLMLFRMGYTPWNYTRFLEYATERLFLQKVGGGYIFIHRMLLEHFAQMELE